MRKDHCYKNGTDQHKPDVETTLPLHPLKLQVVGVVRHRQSDRSARMSDALIMSNRDLGVACRCSFCRCCSAISCKYMFVLDWHMLRTNDACVALQALLLAMLGVGEQCLCDV